MLARIIEYSLDFPPLLDDAAAPPVTRRLWSSLSSGLGRTLGLLAGDY